jgi:hypothetical protein
MVIQLLSHSKKNAKGKTYTYYSLAEPYWDGKKNKKRNLGYIGTLTPLQVQQIRNTLRVTQSSDTFTATLFSTWIPFMSMNPEFTVNSQQSKNKRKRSSNGFTRPSHSLKTLIYASCTVKIPIIGTF